ncbi:VOC family protein [Mycobacterium sp. GA-1841]|uniref:VOC family protein n=1 Tax=Mycobacterium sp. GA-1841 TaxID=1834154 RepID=UPI00158898C8|nr:VOC family protein [Mycobacterium sp. GA-1841]
MRAVHHTAIITDDIDVSLRFWRDGLGLTQFMDHTFVGDWKSLFGADTDTLRSVFLGDPDHPDGGIVELVRFVEPEDGGDAGVPPPQCPRRGLFLVSLHRGVEDTLMTLSTHGFTEGVRRISMPAPGGKRVAMAVITAPDGVLVELVGEPE